MLQRGCDPSIQHYTNQNESSVLSTWREIYPYYAYFANMVGNSSLGRAIAFVQGELTAIGDDFAALSKSYTNLWKGSAQSDLWAYSGLDGYVYSSSTQYMPFFGHKNEMSFGRVMGHLLVALTGSAETAASFFGAGMLEGGGAVLAPETGGASLVASTAVSSTLIAVFGKQGISIAKEGVAGLFNDPNINFSKVSKPAFSNSTIRPEAAITGSKKHGVNWTEGPARAIKEGKPQGQWAASDLDYATEMAGTLKPKESAIFDLPEGAQSVVYMPDGTVQQATRMWIRNNGTGTWHGYPMP